MRAPSPAGSPAALSMIKLAAGDVHLVQDRVHALGEHARTVGVQVEAAFVADDGLVDAAFVALALVVGLRKQKNQRQPNFKAPFRLQANLTQIRFSPKLDF